MQWLLRDAKMRRFCNYIITLFDIEHLEPFLQFMKQEEVEDIKTQIITRCNNFLDKR